MSPQDSQLLQDFLNQLVQVRGVPKDPEADAMIRQAVAQQPDAAYLLVQRALLQQQALDHARAEIAALQQQVRGAQGNAGGFLDPHAWGNSAGGPAHAYGGPVAQTAYPHQPCQQPHPPTPSRFGALRGGMGGMGGMLGNIASTAAGVAAGAFLFQGLGNLLGNHDGNGFLGSQEGFDSLASNLDDAQGNAQLASGNTDNLLGGDGGNTLGDDLGLDDIGCDSFDGGSGDDLFG